MFRFLSTIMFFGITERFRASLCLFTWMYGGSVKKEHLNIFRKGDYVSRSIEEVLSPEEQLVFLRSERFDLELYDFAIRLFESRYTLTSCN